jgi:hypothetical protein
MKVFILCKRFEDSTNKAAFVNKIMAVFEDSNDAYHRVNAKKKDGDYSWYIVAKDLRPRAVKNAVA